MKTKRLEETIEWTVVCCLIMGFISCASPISKDLRTAAKKDLTFQEVFQHPDAYAGSIVIWGGRIIKTLNNQTGTEIIILESPLDYREEPTAEESSRGRFIARTPKFLDPVVYRRGKKITVAGQILGKEIKALGKIEYTYPVVEIKEVHLWQKTKWYQPYSYEWDPYWDYSFDDYPNWDPFWAGFYPFPRDPEAEGEEDRGRK